MHHLTRTVAAQYKFLLIWHSNMLGVMIMNILSLHIVHFFQISSSIVIHRSKTVNLLELLQQHIFEAIWKP